MPDMMGARSVRPINTALVFSRLAILVYLLLFMSKRKITVGGYQDSSDDGDSLNDDPRRLKPTPYAPPRLTAASRLGSGSFKLPASSPHVSVSLNRHVSVSSSASRQTPLPESVQSTRNTPEIQIVPNPVPVSRGSTVGPSSATTLTVPKDGAKLGPKLLDTYKPNNARSTLVLERQINELAGTFETYKHTSEERQKATDDTLARILETVSRLESPQTCAATESPAFSRIPSSSPDVKAYLSNPSPTPELITIVSKVVSEARSRVGKKKGGADDNSCKEHARNTFYRMLGITAAREVRPYFEDEYGDPDTLPSQFVDPETRYCPPYPHWKAPLTKQVAWIPTYILRFRLTIPNDRSDLSNVLRNLSDEAIVVLLNDGPFKSATAAWRDAKKSDAEIEVLRSNSRRYQRNERETNLYDAISAAEREKAKAKPGLCPRLPRRQVEIIKCPVPHLERGTGSGKVTIRIAVCGISKTWRHNHPDDFRKHAHLINMKEAVKPDITSFLEQHPMPNVGGDEDNELGGDSNDGTVKLETNFITGEGEQFGVWNDLDYDGEEESGAVLEMGTGLFGYATTDVKCAPETLESKEQSEIGNMIHIPIDPQLIDEDSGNEDKKPEPPRALSEPHLTAADASPSSGDDTTRLFPNPGMPPPPSPDHNQDLVASQAASNTTSPIKSKGRARTSKVSGIEASVDGVGGGESSPSGASAPKRRGRPPGSKNKKTKAKT